MRKSCDALLQIEGFTENHVIEFVTKYFKDTQPPQMTQLAKLSKLSQITNQVLWQNCLNCLYFPQPNWHQACVLIWGFSVVSVLSYQQSWSSPALLALSLRAYLEMQWSWTVISHSYEHQAYALNFWAWWVLKCQQRLESSGLPGSEVTVDYLKQPRCKFSCHLESTRIFSKALLP